MESLFDMQRFDPDAEAAGEEPLQANTNLDNLKHKLKRKLDDSENVTNQVDENDKGEEEPPPKKKKKKNKKKTADIENIEGFTILGDFTDKSKVKVNRVLPTATAPR